MKAITGYETNVFTQVTTPNRRGIAAALQPNRRRMFFLPDPLQVPGQDWTGRLRLKRVSQGPGCRLL